MDEYGGGHTATAGADAPKRTGEIEVEMMAAEAAVAVLSDIVGSLYARLQPVLGPDSPNAPGPVGEDPHLTKIGQRMADLSRGVRSATGMVVSMLERLEL